MSRKWDFIDRLYFVKLSTKKIPGYKIVLRRQAVYAFWMPQVTPGHTLVVPEKHVTDIFEYDEDLAKEVFSRIPKIARAIEKAFPDCQGMNILNNNKARNTVCLFYASCLRRFLAIPKKTTSPFTLAITKMSLRRVK